MIATGNKNHLWAHYAISWAELQGKGASLIAVAAVPGQLVDYSRLGEVAKLQQHSYGALILRPGSAEEGEVEVLRAADAEDAGALGPEELEMIRDANLRGGRGHQRRTERRGGQEGEEEEEEGVRLERARREAELAAPWFRTPEWLPKSLETAQEREARLGEKADGGATEVLGTHVVAFSGPLAYCVKCANFAHKRVGAGITGICAAPSNKKANAVASRLDRLRRGRHPLTGRLL